MKFRNKKPQTVEATRWFKNGDHPLDDVMRPFEDTGKVPTEPREGAVVRYFRHPGVDGKKTCESCGSTMHEHGWIDCGSHEFTVCPGDWVITVSDGEFFPVDPCIFGAIYEAEP